VAILLQKGADFDSLDDSEIIKILLPHRAGSKYCDRIGNSFLYVAAKKNASGMLKILLQYGADASSPYKDGKSQSRLAAESVTLLEYCFSKLLIEKMGRTTP
jgi:hypothetical protein